MTFDISLPDKALRMLRIASLAKQFDMRLANLILKDTNRYSVEIAIMI